MVPSSVRSCCEEVIDACRIQAKLAGTRPFCSLLMEYMPVQNRHSFITVSVVLDKSIKFRYCSRKLNIQVLAREIGIMSDHLFASVWVL